MSNRAVTRWQCCDIVPDLQPLLYVVIMAGASMQIYDFLF